MYFVGFIFVASCIALVVNIPGIVAARAVGVRLGWWEFVVSLLAFPAFLGLALFEPNLGGQEAFGILDGLFVIPLASASYLLARAIIANRMATTKSRLLSAAILLAAFVTACLFLYGKHTWI